MSQARLSYLAIPILGVMTGNAALSLDMYLPAFPTIANDFGVGEADVQVTMSTFLAGFAIGQAVYGPLSDRFGRKPVILIGLVLYGLVSALCALGTQIDDLVTLRALQGLVGASGSVLGRAVIRDVYEGPRLAKAMSLLMLVLTAGPMIAPILGSAVLDLWGWRSIFWTLSAYAALWSVLIFIMIPETLPLDRRASIQTGAVARAFAEVLTHKQAMGYTLTVAFGFAGMFAYITATPFVYMDLYGITPQEYALFFAANIIAMALSTFINGRLIGRISSNMLMAIFTGILLVSAACLIGAAVTETAGLWGLVIPLFFYVGSLSAIAANGIAGTLQYFGHIAGTASSVFGIFQFGFGSLAGAILATFSNGTAMPMVWVILACACLSSMAFHFMARSE